MDPELEALQNELLNTSHSADDEEITAQKVLQVIEEAWLNEKFSPEILPHKSEFVECMLEQIQCMQSNIKNLPKDDIKVDIHNIELERIKYTLTSYLRCRLKKIETFAFFILEQEAQRDPENMYLSDNEREFAQQYVQHMDTHFSSVLKEMPWNLQTLDSSCKRIKPNVESYVFLKTNKQITNVIVKDNFDKREEEVTLQVNSQHLLPYSSVADYVKSGAVQLI